jgi:hypothetical protein
MWMLLSFSLHDDVQMLRWNLSSGSEEDRSLVAVATCGREYGYCRVDLPRSGVLTSDALGIQKMHSAALVQKSLRRYKRSGVPQREDPKNIRC